MERIGLLPLFPVPMRQYQRVTMVEEAEDPKRVRSAYVHLLTYSRQGHTPSASLALLGVFESRANPIKIADV